MPQFSRKLRVNQGSTRSWDLLARNSDGEDENVGSVTDATFVVKDRIGGTEVISFGVVAGGMSIDSSTYTFTVFSCEPTQEQADTLQPGTYVGQLRILTPTGWRSGDIFQVIVSGTL